jgi:hypothetical protein
VDYDLIIRYRAVPIPSDSLSPKEGLRMEDRRNQNAPNPQYLLLPGGKTEASPSPTGVR